MNIHVQIFEDRYSTLWRRQWHPTPALLPGKSHGWRSLVGCRPCGRWESDTTERLHFHFSLACIGEGNGNPLQCSCLENPRDRGAWWAAIYGVAQSRTQLMRLSSSSSSTQLFWVLEAWSLNHHWTSWKSMAHSKIERKVQRFPIYPRFPCPYTGITFLSSTPTPHLPTQQHGGTFVTIDELTLKDHDHSKSIAYFMVHAWCTFHGLDKCIMTWHATTTTLLRRVFPLPQKSSVLHLFILPFPQLLTTTDVFTVSTVLPFPECHIVKIIQSFHIVLCHFVICI